uniref:Uncharacterized protein n=1 Tax=Oryza brachyantha TaxID=4533 RepID=J3M629_ORYBR
MGSMEESRQVHRSSAGWMAVDGEALRHPTAGRKKGGWVTFPFMAVTMAGLGLATAGATGNLVVYLVKEYHVPSVDAAQISTVVLGCLSVAPVAGAIVADAFFGCYPVVAVAMAFSVLGSPFTGIARVIIAAARKRKVNVAASGELKFYHGRRMASEDDDNFPPSNSFRFLNRAAVIPDGDVNPADGEAARPWRVCTVQQVEDLKAVLRILPLWSSSIILSVSIGVQINFSVLEALVMDRALGRFTVPAASFFVSSLFAVVVFLGLIDRAILPLWRRLTGGHVPTPLQRIGAGHALTVVTLYYQEFPPSLKNTATGMVAMIIALGFYLSTALVDVVRSATAWLPDNMNASRLENLYWLLAVLVAVNFAYYLTCAKLYKYQNAGK